MLGLIELNGEIIRKSEVFQQFCIKNNLDSMITPIFPHPALDVEFGDMAMGNINIAILFN